MIRNAIALAAFAASTVFAADATLISLVPADAKVIAGVNLATAENSPFGQYVLSQIRDSDKDFENFVTASGFDPRRDVREVVFASPAGGHKSPGVVIAGGVFNGPQILSAIQAKETGGTMTTYNGVSLLDKDGHSVGFADGSIAFAGQSALVRAAIDRRGSSPPLSAFASKALATGKLYDVWMVTNGLFVAPLPKSKGAAANSNPLGAVNLQGILETSGGLTLGTVVQFNAEALTRSNQDAQAMADVVKFIASMVQMNGNQNSEFAAIQTILQSLNVQTDGTTVKMSCAIPEQDLEKLLNSRPRNTRSHRAALGKRSDASLESTK